MTKSAIKSGGPFPYTPVKALDGNEVSLGEVSNTADWRLVVVYRSRHCPLCTKYLNALEGYREKLMASGIEIVAVSADEKARLEEHLSDLDVQFPIYYGLTIEQMQTLGLYITSPTRDYEPDYPYAEPGLFVIDDKGQLLLIDISNAAYARPELEPLLSTLELVKENDIPILGTYE